MNGKIGERISTLGNEEAYGGGQESDDSNDFTSYTRAYSGTNQAKLAKVLAKRLLTKEIDFEEEKTDFSFGGERHKSVERRLPKRNSQ